MTAGGLHGKRILVVEDEYFIASDLKRTLKKEGATLIGPVGVLSQALMLIEEPMDAALLDVNLSEELSFPLADRLKDRDIPFMFLTGYDDWALPEKYRQTVRLVKPFAPQSVVAMVEQLFVVDGGVA